MSFFAYCLSSISAGRFRWLAAGGLMLIGACGSDGPILEGDRIPIELSGISVEVVAGDDSFRSMMLDAPTSEPQWTHLGGSASHRQGHLALSPTPELVWQAEDSVGSPDRLFIPPIVVGGMLFTLDSYSDLTAVDAQDGRRLWRYSLRPEDEDNITASGGLAFYDGRLFITTGYGEVVALRATDGYQLWRVAVAGGIRSAPAVAQGRVAVVTINNQTLVFSADDGRQLWFHDGTPESVIVLGAVGPAMAGDMVVASYSSGEVYAFLAESGSVVWFDSLVGGEGGSALASLTDIVASPVIDDQTVLMLNQTNQMIALEWQSGFRLWEQPIGGLDTPWVSGNRVFVLANSNRLLALDLEDGQPVWAWETPTPDERWTGPVLAGGQLWLTSVQESQGRLVAFSPSDGTQTHEIALPEPSSLAPVIANATLYVLTDEGTLLAYR